MLGEVSGQDNEQLVKSIEIGDLSMWTDNKAVEDLNKPLVLKESDGTPERSFFTPWFLCNGNFFRIHLIIVGPQAEEPESYLPLSRREEKDVFKEMHNIVKLLEKELSG